MYEESREQDELLDVNKIVFVSIYTSKRLQIACMTLLE